MGAILFDESMGLLLRWANAVRPSRKGVVAGVKSVGADTVSYTHLTLPTKLEV